MHGLLASALALALPLSAQEASLPSSPTQLDLPALPVYSPPPIIDASLDCGARLLVLEDHELPLVDGVLRFHAGSIHEDADHAGLVRLLADALREGGSEQNSGTTLDTWLDAHAAEIEISADLDSIELSFSCLAEDVEPLFRRLGQLLRSPAYPKDVVKRARQRLLTEIERRADDTGALAELATALVAYGEDSPYARAVTKTSAEACDRDDLLAFHRAHFGPDRLVVGVTGDVTAVEFTRILEETLAELPAVGPLPDVVASAFIQPSQTRVYVVDRPGVTQSELRITAPGTRRSDPDYAPLFLWSHAFGIGGMTNRMVVKVRTELGLAYTVGGFFGPEWNRAGRFQAFCGTRNEAVGEALTAMIEVIDSGLEPISEEHLATVRARVENADVFRIDSTTKILTRAVDLAFNGYPSDFWEQQTTRLRKATSTDLSQAAGRRLNPERLVIVVVGPADEILPHLEGFGQLVMYDPEGPGRPEIELPTEVLTMFEAIGGRDLWSRLAAWEADITVQKAGQEIPTRQWRDVGSPRYRADFQIDGVTMTQVLDGDHGWSESAQGRVTLTPEQIAPLKRNEQRSLWYLLTALARGRGFNAIDLDDQGLIRIQIDSTLSAHLELDADHRPQKIRFTENGATRILTYGEWSLQEGYSYPTLASEPAEATKWKITRFKPLTAFDPSVLESR